MLAIDDGDPADSTRRWRRARGAIGRGDRRPAAGRRGPGVRGRRRALAGAAGCAVRLRHAAARTTGARSSPGVHPALLPGWARVRRRRGARRGRGGLGPDHRRRRRARTGRDPRGVRRPGDRRAVPDRGRPAPRLPRRRARPPGARRTSRHKVVQSLELGSLEPYADAFLPPPRSWRRTGTSPTWEGRGQRIRPIRGPAGIALPGLGDLREPGAGRAAATWASRRSRSSTRRWAGCWRRASVGERRSPARDRAAPHRRTGRCTCSRTRCSSTRGGCPSAPTS